MTIKNNTLAPNLYACGTMNIEGLMLLVKQVSKKGELHTKLPGGTYMGPREKWVAQGEESNHYYINSNKSVEEKITLSLGRAFGKFTSEENKAKFSFLTAWIMEFINTGNEIYESPGEMKFAKTHLVIEWIEELGIIPVHVTFLCSTPHGEHTKYAFEVTQALTFSANADSGKGDFIALERISDIPERNVDFECSDFEVKETVLMSETETRNSNFAWGIHTEARDVIFLNWDRQRSA